MKVSVSWICEVHLNICVYFGICAIIEIMIGKFTEKAGEAVAIGIKDIARAAGVSASTVSNVINGRKNVSASVRERVLAICREMDYQVNPAGKALRTGEPKTILFNFSDFDRQFYLKIIHGISDYVYSRDYDLIICTSRSCERFMSKSITTGCIMRGTYLNGVYDIVPMKQAEPLCNLPESKEAMLNIADTQGIELFFDGERFSLFEGKVEAIERTLDMDAGTTTRKVLWVAPSGSRLQLTFTRMITSADVNRPGLLLAGYHEYFDPTRIQICGKVEMSFLEALPETERRSRIHTLFATKPTAVVVTRSLYIYDAMICCNSTTKG